MTVTGINLVVAFTLVAKLAGQSATAPAEARSAFDRHRLQAKALEQEVDIKTEAGKDITDLLVRLTDARNKAIQFGLAHARLVDKPGYDLLDQTMRLAERVRDWKSCESAARMTLRFYGRSKFAALPASQVRAVLGHALLQQKRFQEAYEFLNAAEKELVGEAKNRSAYFRVLGYKTLALSGWPVLDESTGRVYFEPGLGRPTEGYKLFWQDKKLRNFMLSSPRYSLDWYEYYLRVYYYACRAKAFDSRFNDIAPVFYDIARGSDDFGRLERLGPEGIRIATLFRQLK